MNEFYSHSALALVAMLMLYSEWVFTPILALALLLTLALCVKQAIMGDLSLLLL